MCDSGRRVGANDDCCRVAASDDEVSISSYLPGSSVSDIHSGSHTALRVPLSYGNLSCLMTANIGSRLNSLGKLWPAAKSGVVTSDIEINEVLYLGGRCEHRSCKGHCEDGYDGSYSEDSCFTYSITIQVRSWPPRAFGFYITVPPKANYDSLIFSIIGEIIVA